MNEPRAVRTRDTLQRLKPNRYPVAVMTQLKLRPPEVRWSTSWGAAQKGTPRAVRTRVAISAHAAKAAMHASGVAIKKFAPKQKRPSTRLRRFVNLIPAMTYSPTQLPAQYHGPWRA